MARASATAACERESAKGHATQDVIATEIFPGVEQFDISATTGCTPHTSGIEPSVVTREPSREPSAVARVHSRTSAESRPSRISSRRRMLTELTADMSDEVHDLVSFREETDLLKASRLTSVLRCGAAILQESEGSAETYSLSEVVTAIDVFLSHNWAVSGTKKFFCLVFHFNFNLAVLVAFTALAVAATAASFGYRLFVVERPMSAMDTKFGSVQNGCGCSLLMAPAFVLALCFGHECQRFLGFRGCTIFLDKTCIHQSDKQMQRKGIGKLGAFLRSSSRMVVIYTDLYLTKLWTVYEVACFLALHPTSQLMIVPTYQPLIFFAGVAVMYIVVLLLLLLGNQGPVVALVNATQSGCVLVLLSIFLRWWAREKEAIRQRVANFKVDECACSCEEDRPLVHKNIILIMRTIGEADEGATDEEVLDIFNSIVRKNLSQCINVSIGPLGMAYRLIATIFFCTLIPYNVDSKLLGVVAQPEEWNMRWRIGSLVRGATSAFGMYPLMIGLLAMWQQRCLFLKGFREWVYLGTGSLLILACSIVLHNFTERLVWAAALDGPYRDAFAVCLIASFVTMASVAIIIFTHVQKAPEAEEEQQNHAEGVAAEVQSHRMRPEEAATDAQVHVADEWEEELTRL